MNEFYQIRAHLNDLEIDAEDIGRPDIELDLVKECIMLHVNGIRHYLDQMEGKA